MKILLVEDNPDDLFFAERELRGIGHEVVGAADGNEALKLFHQEQPDLVITDVDLPGTDGFALTRAVQQAAAPRWQPVIFLSGQRDEELQVRALSVGADAYIVKPVPAAMLAAKLNVIARLLATQRQAEDRAAELERYYAADSEDRRIAQHLLERLVNRDKLDDAALHHWVSPAALFSGDVVAAGRTPGGVLHVLLADSTGHGLAASINVLPIIAPFYRMTEKGFGIETIIRELNRKVRELLPTDRFVAATVVAVDAREGIVRLWNGGNPEPCMIDRGGRPHHVFINYHLPLGVLEDTEFDAVAEAHAFDPEMQLLLYSDGLVEVENGEGEAFGRDRLEAVLAEAPPAGRLDRVVQALTEHAGGRPARDDVSFLLIDCLPEPGAAEQHPANAAAVAGAMPGNWRFSLTLTGAELRKIDVVPILLGLANHFEGARDHSGELFVVLAELFNNALDHGLLRLDSGRKLSPDGLESWLTERAQRLDALDEGEIGITVEQLVYDERAWLRIVCRDSGPGFDHAAKPLAPIGENELPFGRGIALVRQMTSQLEYNDAGNEVRALLPLTRVPEQPGAC